MADASKILIVEDEESLLKLESILLTTKGYSVQGVSDGKEAVEVIRVDPPDLVLLDIMLPGMNGFEVCHWIKNDPSSCHIPVIILTARKTLEDHARGEAAGADLYMTKPFKSNEIVTAIESLLGR